jgi:hypothetical protein
MGYEREEKVEGRGQYAREAAFWISSPSTLINPAAWSF